jgi:hypothetical protein
MYQRDMSNKTTILLEKATRDDLREIGKKCQSYDSLIRELIMLRKDNKAA